MSKFDEMRQAVSEARATMKAADEVAEQMADLLCGRLRKCNSWTLQKLKRELRDFNIHTRNWSSK